MFLPGGNVHCLKIESKFQIKVFVKTVIDRVQVAETFTEASGSILTRATEIIGTAMHIRYRVIAGVSIGGSVIRVISVLSSEKEQAQHAQNYKKI